MGICRGKVVDHVLANTMAFNIAIVIKHHIDNVILLLLHEISKTIEILFQIGYGL